MAAAETVVTELIIDAGPSESGAARYQVAMAKASSAADRFNQLQARVQDAMNKGTGVMDAAAQRTSRVESAYNRLRAAVDPLAAAEQKLGRVREQSAAAASNAVLHGVATEEQALADLTRLDQQHMQQIEAMRAQQASLTTGPMPRVTGAGVTITDDMERIGKSSRSLGPTLTNLSYQINDVVTGFASGQHPMQIFAQQGGQIFQAFQMGPGGVGGTLKALAEQFVRFLPVILPVTAALVGIGVGVAALTSKLNEGHSKALTWGETLVGVAKTAWQAFTKELGPAPAWMSKLWDQIGSATLGAVNNIIRGVAQLGNEIRRITSEIPEYFRIAYDTAANAAADAVNRMLGGLVQISGVLALLPGVGSQIQTSVLAAYATGGVKGPGTAGIDASRQLIAGQEKSYAADTFRIDQTDYAGQIYKNGLPAAKPDKAAESAAKKWDKLTASVDGDIASLKAQTAALGQSAEQTAYLEEKQTLLNKAKEDGLKLSPTQLATIDREARSYAQAKTQLEQLTEAYNTGKSALEGFASAFKGAFTDSLSQWQTDKNDYVQQLTDAVKTGTGSLTDSQQQMVTSLGASGDQLKTIQDLASSAVASGTKLTDAQTSSIDALATSLANAKDGANAMQRAWTAAWDAMGAATGKVLDDIADKALQMAADGIWNMIWGGISGGGGSGGNILSTVLGFLGGGGSSGGSGHDLVSHAAGGMINGPGTSTSDSIPAWLSNGEFVVNARATAAYRPQLEAMNHFAAGGYVSQPANWNGPSAANGNAGDIHLHMGDTIVNGSGLSADELSQVLAKNNQDQIERINNQFVPAVQTVVGMPKSMAGQRAVHFR